MTIPKRLQVFDAETVLVPDKDVRRLQSCLISWARLNDLFLLDGFNEPDLKRLIILELMDRRRWELVERLLMRLGSIQRKRLREKVRRLCQ